MIRLVDSGPDLERFVCSFCGGDTDDDPRYVCIDLSWPYSVAKQRLGAHHTCLEAALRPGFPLADGID